MSDTPPFTDDPFDVSDGPLAEPAPPAPPGDPLDPLAVISEEEDPFPAPVEEGPAEAAADGDGQEAGSEDGPAADEDAAEELEAVPIPGAEAEASAAPPGDETDPAAPEAPWSDPETVPLDDPETRWQADCAIAAERGVLQDVLGLEVPVAELEDLAVREGWHDPETGTEEEAVGKILESYGVNLDPIPPTDLKELGDDVAEGRVVLVGLDQAELRAPHGPGGGPLEWPDHHHLYRVEEVRRADELGDSYIVLRDPVHPEQVIEVLSEDFLNSWIDTANFAISVEPGGGPLGGSS